MTRAHIHIIIIVLMVFVLTACTSQPPPETPSFSNPIAPEEHGTIQPGTLEGNPDPVAEMLLDAIARGAVAYPFSEEPALQDISLGGTGSGSFTAASDGEYRLYSVHEYAWYLCAYNGDDWLLHFLGENCRSLCDHFLADLDGDGLDEFVLHFDPLAANTIARISLVLRWEDGTLHALSFEDETEEPNKADRCFDLGFLLEFHDNSQYTITNPLAGYTETFPANEETYGWLYLEDGTLDPSHSQYIQKGGLYPNANLLNNFLVFHAIEVDGDDALLIGKPFLLSLQITGFPMGVGYSMVRYNATSDEFYVFDALFVPGWEENPDIDAILAAFV